MSPKSGYRMMVSRTLSLSRPAMAKLCPSLNSITVEALRVVSPGMVYPWI